MLSPEGVEEWWAQYSPPATILVPDEDDPSGTASFFTAAVREILAAAMICLGRRAATNPSWKWTFRDLLLIALTPDDLVAFLVNSDVGFARRVAKMFLVDADERTRANILATMMANLGKYEPIAAAWEGFGPRMLSVKEWKDTVAWIVLGNNESARSTIDPINRAIFQRVSEEILSGPEIDRKSIEDGSERTWIVLDEFREAGRLEGLRSLLKKGRSKGACVILGSQDIEGVRDVYGQNQANELLAQCANSVVLNLGNPATIEWASQLFGSTDVAVASSSASVGSGYSESDSKSTERRTIVTTRELITMPRIGPGQGMSGYFKSPYLDENPALAAQKPIERIAPWKQPGLPFCDWPSIKAHLTSSDWPGFLPNKRLNEFIQDFSPKERQALGLPASQEAPEPEPDAPAPPTPTINPINDLLLRSPGRALDI